MSDRNDRFFFRSYERHLENRRRILELIKDKDVVSNVMIARAIGVSRERGRQYAMRLVEEGILLPTGVKGVYVVNKKRVKEVVL